jgi:hypothetical protein
MLSKMLTGFTFSGFDVREEVASEIAAAIEKGRVGFKSNKGELLATSTWPETVVAGVLSAWGREDMSPLAGSKEKGPSSLLTGGGAFVVCDD